MHSKVQVRAATREVESDDAKSEGGEEGKDVSEKEGGEVEKKKKKRVGFRDRRVCSIYKEILKI